MNLGLLVECESLLSSRKDADLMASACSGLEQGLGSQPENGTGLRPRKH